MNIKSLSDAIANIGNPPCVTYSCVHRERCGKEKLACSAFRYFVKSGRAVTPLMNVPIRITKNHQPELTDSILPSKKIFDSMEVDDDFYKPKDEERKTDQVLKITNAALASKPTLQTVWE